MSVTALKLELATRVVRGTFELFHGMCFTESQHRILEYYGSHIRNLKSIVRRGMCGLTILIVSSRGSRAHLTWTFITCKTGMH